MPESNALRRATARRITSPTNGWSIEEVRRLRQLAEQGKAVVAIAAKLRRTPSAVRNKAGMHGISLQPRRNVVAAELEPSCATAGAHRVAANDVRHAREDLACHPID